MLANSAITRHLIPALLLVAGGLYTASVQSAPITFTYNCTISGTGSGVNVCDQGPNVAQLTIAEVAGEIGVLSLSIQRLFPAPPNGPVDLTLQAVHLNYTGDLIPGTDLYQHLPVISKPPAGAQNDTNSIEFSRDLSFAPLTVIEVLNNSTTALNYKGFDLQLCDSPPGGNGVGLCDVPVTMTDTIFGYIRSGNNFNLTPELFDGLTEDTLHTDEARMFDNCIIMPAHLRSAVKIVEATSGHVANDDVCGGGGNYGPYYGSLDDSVMIPEPNPLLLFGAGMLILGFLGRRRSA